MQPYLLSFSKPLVCLFPPLFKRNLLSFIYLIFPSLPQNSVLQLLKCLRLDPEPSPWVSTLLKQLERSLGFSGKQLLCSPQCSRRLEELSQRLAGSAEPGGWAECFSGQTVEPGSQRASVQGSQRKRKSSSVTQDSEDENTGQPSKRMKVDVSGSETPDAEEQNRKEETSGRLESDPLGETPAAADLQPAADPVCGVLPQHIEVRDTDQTSKWWQCSSVILPHLCVLCICVHIGLCSGNKEITGKSSRGKYVLFFSTAESQWNFCHDYYFCVFTVGPELSECI